MTGEDREETKSGTKFMEMIQTQTRSAHLFGSSVLRGQNFSSEFFFQGRGFFAAKHLFQRVIEKTQRSIAVRGSAAPA
jgi:hypothetical protein